MMKFWTQSFPASASANNAISIVKDKEAHGRDVAGNVSTTRRPEIHIIALPVITTCNMGLVCSLV